MNEIKSVLALLLFGGLGTYIAVGGQIPADPDCFGRCYTATFAEWIDAGYRYPVALGLFATAAYSFFWWRSR